MALTVPTSPKWARAGQASLLPANLPTKDAGSPVSRGLNAISPWLPTRVYFHLHTGVWRFNRGLFLASLKRIHAKPCLVAILFAPRCCKSRPEAEAAKFAKPRLTFARPRIHRGMNENSAGGQERVLFL